MQASQREEYNHALEYAIDQANELGLPLIAYFGLTDNFPEANLRHYTFMLEGLRETQHALAGRGIKMVVRRASPEEGAEDLSAEASLIVVDRGYLRIQRRWRSCLAQRIECPLAQVESDAVVPVEVASDKEEYSAATFRPKINKKYALFLKPLRRRSLKCSSVHLDLPDFDIEDGDRAISQLKIDRSVTSSPRYRGGTEQAKRLLNRFISQGLDHFADRRNNPAANCLSHMSPYLHFGQISPLYIALQISKTSSSSREAYLEELIVRRELSLNFAFYNSRYDSYGGLPRWARENLAAHGKDPRQVVYKVSQLESAQTHDPYWNAAQKEMAITGKMHGYMRMYWGKKILEWSSTPQRAFRTALYLNNKYELDGRDPNGFAGVAWCFGKHDRPWRQRPVFGLVRYMNDRGLRRKFDIDGYVHRIAAMEKSLSGNQDWPSP
jgi:deoxyribodipyrimidine photo-lyase